MQHSPSSRSWARTSHLALLALCALPIAACSGPGFGGRGVEVELRTKPPDATAYVLPESAWAKSGRPLFQAWKKVEGQPGEAQARRELLDWLEGYRQRAKTTPVPCTVSSHHQVLVARLGDRIEYVEFDPAANKAPCLEFPGHG